MSRPAPVAFDASISWDDVVAGAVPFSVPLRHRFRGVTSREGVLLPGPSGWGEFAPFAEYPPEVAARWLAAALEAAFGTWPAPVRDAVPVNAIVPELTPEAAAAHVRECLDRDGTTTVKVKVSAAPTPTSSRHPSPSSTWVVDPSDGSTTHREGAPGAQVGSRSTSSFASDEDRVAAVRAALDHGGAPEGRIRVDVNGAWSVREAVTRLPVLDAAARGLEYAEQPCASLADLAELRRRVNVPIAVDEGVRLAADTSDPRWRRQLREAADVVILKPTPMGGVAAALRVAELARVPVVVSGAMDTSVGLAAGVALAAALPELPFACGLGTGSLLAADLVGAPSRPEGGRLPVVRPHPDPVALAAARERLGDVAAAAWLVRLRAAYDALVAGAR